MIRPITHGIVRFTPVDITRHPTPTDISRHWGLASETSLRIEVTSGEASVFAGSFEISDGRGAVISVTAGEAAGLDGEEGDGRGVSGLTVFGSLVEELKRIDGRTGTIED
jgi:hypothetical protein